MIAHRGRHPATPTHALESGRTPQPRHSFAPNAQALLPEFDLDARRTVGGARALMNLCDPRAEFGICPDARRGRPPEPRVIAAGGDTQYAAHCNNRVHGLVGPYE